MNLRTTTRGLLSLAALFAIATPNSDLAAQTVRVDYDDSALATPPDFGFPFYTPGAGSAGQTVRVQYHCPANFAGLPTTPMLCTKVGFQLSGNAAHDVFELRAGTTSEAALTNVWSTNLPDQRVQHSMPGEVDYGMTSQWVEFDLAYPFVYAPGDHVVVDLTVKLRGAGRFLSTALTTNPTPRVVELDYQGLPIAPAPRTSGGLKFRLVMDPVGSGAGFGTGCAGFGGFVPEIGFSGTAAVGSTGFSVDIHNAAPTTPTGLLLGSARGLGSPVPLPVSYGAGCDLQISADVFSATIATGGTVAGSGTASFPIPIPNDSALSGLVLFAQWLQLDNASAANLPVTFSNPGVFSIQ